MSTRETPKAAAAFREYCALGPGRSLAKLAQGDQKYAKSVPVLKRWSSVHTWVERAKQYDEERAKEKQRKQDEAIEAMNGRHAELALHHQITSAQQIERLIEAKKFGSQASVQLLKLSTDLERLARGEPTEYTRNKTDVTIDVAGFKELLMQRLARLEESKE
jgi:hypothetical protein